MNYTKNYHLPQWDETDRILRTDFNQMCADIENGLSQNAAGSSQANAQTAAAAAAAVQAAENKAFDQACRLAYNHYCLAQTLTPFPRQLGVFHLDTSLGNTGLSGLVKYHDYYQMNNAPSKSSAELLALMEQTPLSMSKNTPSQALTATFTAPSNGLIQGFQLRAPFDEFGGGTPVLVCDLTYKDLTANQTVLTTQLRFTLTGPDGVLSYYIQEPLLISCGHRYQVTLTPTNHVSGTINGQFTSSNFTSGATGGTATASHTFQNPAENLGLLAVASYQFTANCATPKLLAGGQEVPLWWSRTVEDGKGNTIREAVFRRNRAVTNGESLQLQLFCGTGETLTLFSWGATLI